MKKLPLCLLLAALAAPGAHAVPGGEPAARPAHFVQDLGSAGRLRLQSQRLAKLYLQDGLGIRPETARRQLAAGSAQGEKDLVALADYARRPRTQRTLARSAELWNDYRAALARPYAADSVQRVNYLAEELMIAAGRLAMQIEEEADTPVARLLDLAQRQSMLAQRLARLYLLAQSGDRSRGRRVDVEQARKEFAAGLAELDAAPENTPASREALALAKTQWLFFEQAVGDLQTQTPGNADGAGHVASTSERIVEALDAVSAQYARDYAGEAGRGGARRN
ncbi:MAG: type IV pili methyl-accepting chemotaxis transducer N-terminal domain-containing protein [Candidatus Accumulibacter sp.]|nr:type IV pili methyl-accepting chemotaxis transducer N-terminal domain-containing protein [Accumulibacter sp.]